MLRYSYMYIISVMPLERKAHTDMLSYFSTQKIALGTIVEGSWRKKTILGLTTDCTPALKNKLSIKDAGFAIKKIQKVIGPSPLLPEFIQAVDAYKNKFGLTTRKLFDTLVPTKILLEQYETKKKKPLTKQNVSHEALIGSFSFRLKKYTEKILESQKDNRSTLFLVPTSKDADFLEAQLGMAGIENILQIKSQTPLSKNKERVVYIATPFSLGYPFSNIGSIIILSENSHLYVLRNNIHALAFTRLLADALCVPIMWSGSIPSLFLFKDIQEKILDATYEKNKPRIQTTIISTKDRKKPFDKELVKTISDVLKNNGHVFLFALRRGYAEVTICHDCKTILRCPLCNRPLVLHRQGSKNWYLCHHCGTMENTLRKCESCESWNLRPLGIGVDTVFETFQKEFPGTPLYKIDSDTTTTAKKLKDTVDAFYKTGGILVGTEMALRALDSESLDISVITSFDSLFALPHFSIEERMLELLSLLEEKTKGPLVIETLFPEQEIFDAWQNNTVPAYLHSLLEDRKSLNYPPFGGVWVVEKIITPRDAGTTKTSLESTLSSLTPHIHVNKTRDKKLKIGATVVIGNKEKELFEKISVQLKNAGYTLLYNPASIF